MLFCYFVQEGYATMVAHNHPYDLGVLANEWPDFVPVILNLMEKGRLRDTQVSERSSWLLRRITSTSIGSTK